MNLSPTYAKRWLVVGVVALALAGLLAIVLVVARTPQLAELTLFKDLFGKSLVIHVDLSVLVWFLAAAAMFWQLVEHTQERRWHCLRYMRSTALWVFLAGTVLMATSLFMGGEVMKNNYVPVLTNAGFALSVGLVMAGACLAALDTLGRTTVADFRGDNGTLYFGMVASAPVVLVTAVCFYLSEALLGDRVSGEQRFEIIFWGGGHALQFLYVQVMMVAWLWIAADAGWPSLPRRLLFGLLALGPLVALTSPLAYPLYDVTSFEHRQFFTEQMKWGLGIAPTVLGLYLCMQLARRARQWNRQQRALLSSLVMSLTLFFFGGVFGLMIEAETVLVPAHYHGSIVGVTLALMGAAYLLLPRFGGVPVAQWRLAFWQPVFYGVGQLMHISGLAWSGGYEVLRKTPGEVTDSARAAMGFMGLGGLLAIIGGIMFVLVVWKSFAAAKRQ